MDFHITSITIENFRSIAKQPIDLEDITVFVGNNDEGKSNVLRALDLFFNHKTLTPIQFERDFCYFAKVSQNKAKEIRITLNCRVPKSYAAEGEVRWHKVWRKNGIHLDEKKLANGEAFGRRSKIPALLAAVRYHYVPAIKGEEYFSRLLGDIHDMLTETVEQSIRTASTDFTRTINDHTNQIRSEIQEKLGIDSTLQLPADLRELFSRLDFRSSDKDHPISLDQRGDGIKVRHIPIMLSFLANQANSNRVQGSVPIFTIWGYEEPENNLEMAKAVELAGNFRNYSKDIQILLTTHSPAFYSLATKDEQAKLYLVKKDAEQKATELKHCEKGSLCELDKHMGLLPYVVPSFQKAVEEYNQLQKRFEEIESENKATLFLEGKTDKKIVMKAIALFEPELKDKISVKTDDSGGANWVKGMLIAWQYSRKEKNALGVFDKDDAGANAISEFNNKIESCTSKIAKAIKLDAPEHLHRVLRNGFKIPIRIEEMFPKECWQHASEEGWLIPRRNAVELSGFSEQEKSFAEFCNEKGLSDDEQLYVRNEIREDCKDKFAKYVSDLTGTKAGKAFGPLKGLIEQIKTTLLGEEQSSAVRSDDISLPESQADADEIDNPSEGSIETIENKLPSPEATT